MKNLMTLIFMATVLPAALSLSACIQIKTQSYTTSFRDILNREWKDIDMDINSSVVNRVDVDIKENDKFLFFVKSEKSNVTKVTAKVLIFDKTKPYTLSEQTILDSIEMDLPYKRAYFSDETSKIRMCEMTEMSALGGSVKSFEMTVGGKRRKPDTRDRNICVASLKFSISEDDKFEIYVNGKQVVAD